MNKQFDLERFVVVQETAYERALQEIKRGRKQSHWMWFVFPQIAGLGRSEMSQRFAIGSLSEAAAYLKHPVLGPRIVEICKALLAVEAKSARDILGSPDDMKLRSSMTLFGLASSDANSIFQNVLDKYFHGKQDSATRRLLNLTD
jgi:uncharacterized protein (DUF1810 family)